MKFHMTGEVYSRDRGIGDLTITATVSGEDGT